MTIQRLSCLALLAILLTSCGGGGEASTGETGPAAVPTPAGTQARVVDLVNRVDAHALPGADWAPAEIDMTIHLGGQVWAQEASTARLSIEDLLVRVAPNTVFTFSQPSDETLRIDLDEGQIWLNVEGRAPGQELEVETPSAVAAVRGTRFSVRVDADGTTVVSVVQGAVDLTGAGQTVTVNPQHQSAVAPGEAPSTPEPLGPLEQLLWGMAAGAGLDPLYPVYRVELLASLPGMVVDEPPALSPDGRTLIAYMYDPSTGADSKHVFIDTQTGQAFDPGLPSISSNFTFSPQGRLAYFASTNSRVLCFAAPDGSGRECYPINGDVADLSWSPSGASLLVSCACGTSGYDLFVINPRTGELTRLTDAGGYNFRAAWSPDESRIAYVNASNPGATGTIWVMNADGSGAEKLFDGVYGISPVQNGGLDWSADGRWLAVPTVLGPVLLDMAAGGQALQVPAGPEGSILEMAWSPGLTGWPLTFTLKGTNGFRDLYLLTGPEAAPATLVSLATVDTGALSPLADLLYGPYWSADGTTALLGLESKDGGLHTLFYLLRSDPALWP